MNHRSFFTVIALAAAFAFGATAAQAQGKKRTHPHHARPAASAQSSEAAPKAASAGDEAAGAGFGVAESISGTIRMVVADQNLVVIDGPNNVPYDLKVSPTTVIVVDEKRGTIESLASQVGKTASVGFVPKRDGNYANRVEVAGG